MVKIRKRVVGKQTYYYLEHSLKKGKKVVKKEKYLGKKIPANIDKIKRELLFEIYEEKWFPIFDVIKKNYSREIKKMPKVAQEKECETFMVRFTYDTQRIEGSTLTLRETADLLERDITPGARPLADVKEAEAHKNVFYEMLEYEKDLSLQIVLYWHKRLFDLTKPKIAGKIRQYQVAISGSKFMPPFPAEIYPLLREFFKWYNRNKAILHPVALSALVHLKFVTIHPYADGNGRISRLMQNFVLNNLNYPMLNIPYENRNSYYNALERSQIKDDENIFLQWFFRRYKKENKRYLGEN
jgi:Fic family protein